MCGRVCVHTCVRVCMCAHAYVLHAAYMAVILKLFFVQKHVPVSGGEDCSVRLWETSTGRCVHCIAFDDPVMSVTWCPNPALNLLLVAR